MHELALCQELICQLEALANQHRAERVDLAVVLVGPLSGAEPSLLQSAFIIARSGTVAGTARLEIETAAIRVLCKSCGSRSEATPTNLTCRDCGGWKVVVEEGHEMILKTVEFTRATAAMAPDARLSEPIGLGDQDV